jgi:hypothetical protein
METSHGDSEDTLLATNSSFAPSTKRILYWRVYGDGAPIMDGV